MVGLKHPIDPEVTNLRISISLGFGRSSLSSYSHCDTTVLITNEACWRPVNASLEVSPNDDNWLRLSAPTTSTNTFRAQTVSICLCPLAGSYGPSTVNLLDTLQRRRMLVHSQTYPHLLWLLSPKYSEWYTQNAHSGLCPEFRRPGHVYAIQTLKMPLNVNPTVNIVKLKKTNLSIGSRDSRHPNTYYGRGILELGVPVNSIRSV